MNTDICFQGKRDKMFMYINSKNPQKCSAHVFVVVFKHPFGINTIWRVFLFFPLSVALLCSALAC